jgi:hypothetical protein
VPPNFRYFMIHFLPLNELYYLLSENTFLF